MIIKQLRAENILKYAALHLTNIPASGLIGVSGANESGKTSIAEIICLALFGRTFVLPQQELAKCIKWGEFRGSVELVFTDKSGHSYTITRALDSDGNHSARLTRSDNETPIARGAQAVSQAVIELGGWTYEQFIASLYLAQRSITLPTALTRPIKTLAGVELLETIAAEFAQEVHETQAACSRLRSQLDETQAQLQALGPLDDQLSRLQAERGAQSEQITTTETEAAQLQSTANTLQNATARVTTCVEQFVGTGLSATYAQWQTSVSELDGALNSLDEIVDSLQLNSDTAPTRELHAWQDDVHARLSAFKEVQNLARSHHAQLAHLIGVTSTTDATPNPATPLPERESALEAQLQALVQRRRRAQAGLWLTLLVAVVSGGAWGLVSFARDLYPSRWLVSTFGEQVFSHPFLLPLVAGGASLLCLIFLIGFIRSSSRIRAQHLALRQARVQLENARQQLQLLEPLSQLTLPATLETLQQVQDKQMTAAVSAFTDGIGAPLVRADAFAETMAHLQTALTAGLSRLRTMQEQLGEKSRSITQELDNRRQARKQLEQQIAVEQSRREQIERTDAQQRTLLENIEKCERQIALRHNADKLLNGFHSRLYTRFNLELQQMVSKILPLLTEGRYQSVLVTHDGQLQLLSPTKGNFVGLNEISGGSYHQVWLAVRLALSHAIISATGGAPQFLILDEPFAFFDNVRTRRTLDLLSHLSNDITQVWVIAPQYDPDINFALHLHCTNESDSLIVSGG